MSIKEDIIALLNAVYRQDVFISDFTEATAKIINLVFEICKSIKNNFFFDSLDEEGVFWWENHLKIDNRTASLDDRRSRIQAKWLSKSHNDINLLQKICNSWKKGEVELDFLNGKYQIKFVGAYGVPSDLELLKNSIEEAKKAYIGYELIYRYLRKKEIHHVLTKSQMQAYKKNQYCKVGVN